VLYRSELIPVAVLACMAAESGKAQGVAMPSDSLAPAALQGFVNVRAFGCYGDDQHDDTGCFVAARDYLQSHTRANTTPASDRNRLGGAMLYVPAGTYLITQPDAMMSHFYKARTNGYHLAGSGSGITLIDYRPKTHGPLFFNNDAWLGVSIHNISFTSNDSESDFWDSYAAGGAQGCRFSEVSWSGAWANLFKLTGTNNNSEFDWDHVTIAGSVRSALYIPPTESSDQFLNYWFRNSKIWLSSGNFIEAHKGGHFKIDDCDFSGLRGSGNPNSPSVLFGLYGNVHARGVTHFECRNSRFELITNSVKVLHSEWGSMGQVSFEDDDFSSQAGNYPPVEEFQINMAGAGGAVQYSFVRCQLMGFVQIDFANTEWGYRRNVTFQDVQFNSYDDYSLGVRFTAPLPAGSNYGAIPIVECIRCRGANRNIARIEEWRDGATYHSGDQAYSNGYVYRAEGSGIAGSNPPTGRVRSFSDGKINWSVIDVYWGSDYLGDCLLRPSQFVPNGYAMAERSVIVNSPAAYNFPFSKSAAISGFARLILAQFTWVTRMQLVVLPGTCSQASPGTYVVRTDSPEPHRFFAETLNPLKDGGTRDYILSTPYASGAEIGSRTIILEATSNVTEACGGFLVVWYI
jgi:Pectate lyase superfamily protein